MRLTGFGAHHQLIDCSEKIKNANDSTASIGEGAEERTPRERLC